MDRQKSEGIRERLRSRSWKVALRRLLSCSTLILFFTAGCKDGPPTEENAHTAHTPGLLLERSLWEALPPDQRTLLRSDPYAYFRFTNTLWAQEVCGHFGRRISQLPWGPLHGDAHLEQYAYTSTDHGLDDFDDAAFGPPVIDVVRFLSSVELTLRRRGWTTDREGVVDEFFRGYREVLTNPQFVPPTPAYVDRTRAGSRPSRREFLDWTESLLTPLESEHRASVDMELQEFLTMMMEVRPELSPEYWRLKNIGVLRMGVGSALTPKHLMRFEGETPNPSDDVILEAKELSDLGTIGCISRAGETLRVLRVQAQLGRIHHDVIAVFPRHQQQEDPDTRSWWVRSWEPSYGELDIDAVASPSELAEIVRDVGAQLGDGHVPRGSDEMEAQARYLQRRFIDDHAGTMREVALAMTKELLESWELLRADVTSYN